MATPRPAASVLVMSRAHPSDLSNEPKILMVKRHSKARFMADVYVFPGGCVDADDASRGLAAINANAPSSGLHGSTTLPSLIEYRTAAVRELQEETGCQLHDDGSLTIAEDNFDGGHPSSGRLLIPYAHWVTPKQEKYRYDTRFFILPVSEEAASLPVKADPKEVADIKWVTPTEAILLHLEKGNGFTLPPPTLMLMHYLSTFDGGLDAIVDKYTQLYKDNVDLMPRIEPALDLSYGLPIHSYMKPKWTHLEPGVHHHGPAVIHVQDTIPEFPAYGSQAHPLGSKL